MQEGVVVGVAEKLYQQGQRQQRGGLQVEEQRSAATRMMGGNQVGACTMRCWLGTMILRP